MVIDIYIFFQLSKVQKRGSLADSYKKTRASKWAPSNHFWPEPTSYRGRIVIRSSSETESSSNNSTRPRRRDSRQYRAFFDNNLRYKKREVSQGRRRFDSLRPNREEGFMLPEAKGYSASKGKGGKKRSPLIKQQRVASYDSGYPAEDERRKGLKTIKQSVSQSSAMVSNKMRHPALCRKCRTLTTDGYAVRNWFTPDLNACESSDDEVFDEISRSDSWCGDFEVPPYNLRERRETKTRTNCHQNRYKPKATPNNSGHLTRGRRHRSAYQAMAMYQAMSENEIDLYEGDKVKVIRKSRSGWWYVNIDHEEGWAPSNFLKPIPWCGK